MSANLFPKRLIKNILPSVGLRGDVSIATDISGGERRGVARSGAAGCEPERDRGVCGGEDAVAARGRRGAVSRAQRAQIEMSKTGALYRILYARPTMSSPFNFFWSIARSSIALH